MYQLNHIKYIEAVYQLHHILHIVPEKCMLMQAKWVVAESG